MKDDRFFFEIPIYRCAEDKFIADYDRDLDKHLDTIWPNGEKELLSREFIESVEQRFWERYGTPWKFNQTVGWLRLFITGSQIRADLWFTNAKRLLRYPKHRQISLVGKGFELSFWPENTSEEIFKTILNELIAFGKTFYGGHLEVDLECFENIGPHIDWRSLIGFNT